MIPVWLWLVHLLMIGTVAFLVGYMLGRDREEARWLRRKMRGDRV